MYNAINYAWQPTQKPWQRGKTVQRLYRHFTRASYAQQTACSKGSTNAFVLTQLTTSGFVALVQRVRSPSWHQCNHSSHRMKWNTTHCHNCIFLLLEWKSHTIPHLRPPETAIRCIVRYYAFRNVHRKARSEVGILHTRKHFTHCGNPS